MDSDCRRKKEREAHLRDVGPKYTTMEERMSVTTVLWHVCVHIQRDCGYLRSVDANVAMTICTSSRKFCAGVGISSFSLPHRRGEVSIFK